MATPDPPPTLRRQITDWFVPYRADEPDAGRFRARQLQAVQRMTPLALAANALNALLLVLTFWPTPQRVFTLVWTAGVALLMLKAWLAWRTARRTGGRPLASRRAMRRATLNATVLAALWALVPLVLFPHTDSGRQLLVATLTTGMMCAGGFALATAPVAGTAFAVILGGAAAAALALSGLDVALPVGALLLIYSLFVVGSVWSTARMFGAQMVAEAQAERQNEVIGLLLRDFEERASDLLWQIDVRGHLSRVSPRLALLFGQPAVQLEAMPVLDALHRLLPADGSGHAQLEDLRRHIERGQPFRDLPLATERDGRTRWWSLSAKPLLDAQGRPAGWRGVSTDVTEAQRANRQLTWLAHFDPLTGLANRHHFRARLSDLLMDLEASDGDRHCAVLCLDLDHFKSVNDTLGHAVGDGLLQQVAQRLLANTRRSDTVARLGGDEFAVILHDVASVDEAELLTRRLLDGLQVPCVVQGAHIAMSVSIGVAMAPRDGHNIDALLNHADLALYAAKSAGRAALRFYTPQMAAQTRRRAQLEQALREALARGELSLAFQPQVDLASWRITGFEALLRWQHPELGTVSPEEFVPVAEDAGLIAEIGSWVMREACMEAQRWPGELEVSVNVSAVQAMSSDLRQCAQRALADSGLAPARLELEITESIFLQEGLATMRTLHEVRGLGLRIALDDFGTGYSSLAYLRRFPFDTLKIDRSFVRELMSRPDARAIVRMIVGLSHTLKMRTVAEGVEELAQADVMQRYGCNLMQGWLAARPMAAAAIPAFLAGWSARLRPSGPVPLATTAMPLDGGG